MLLATLFAFLHFVAAFGIAATLFLEWQTLTPSPTHAEAVRLQRVDAWYGGFAVVVLVVGTLRVMYFEKGHAFYTGNPFFHAKIGLFVAIGLLSIYPTVRFVKWRAQTRQGLPPVVSADEYRRLRAVLRLEVLLLAALLLCASLMARGVGR